MILEHEPVLIREIEDIFVNQTEKNVVVDATLGLGGHSKMFISHMDQEWVLLGIDRDTDNLKIAQENLEMVLSPVWGILLVRESFSELEKILQKHNLSGIDFILYDLWVSSAHYDDGDRGFSVRFEAPLDMRFDRTSWKTAADLLREMGERELMKIFADYADEKKAFFIAKAIVEARKIEPISTTGQLLEIIEKASFDKKSPIRVFQALRIAVNEEFDHIGKSIDQAVRALHVGGKIAVITFHSIEDRFVKQHFLPYTTPTCDPITWQIIVWPVLRKVTKKPIEPTEQEVMSNPRSRSAKLRILEKIS